METLKKHLQQFNQKSYGLYKKLQGQYDYKSFKLFIDYVQGDPFASPSNIRIVIPEKTLRVESEWLESKRRRIYVEDYIARVVHKAILNEKTRIKGSGKSGLIAIDVPDQEILERTAVKIESNQITICLSIGLPANGRRINGVEAEKLFFKALPNILKHSIFSLNKDELQRSTELADQHDAIRKKMKEEGWIAFIANGSILPRESGISSKPMKNAVPFKSPKENEVSFPIPHRNEPISGMAIKKGITLIVGGGFHGKSTLLEALELGVYEHTTHDGREYVLTDPNAVKIRAEDGRSISKVDISSFISNLPNNINTESFSTENASGSTSQAGNVTEALEAGATTLLIDEDTSATNFMIRDRRMQKLVAKDKEPITPFVQKVKHLRDEYDISTVLVMGGSGDYFDLADEVIMMDEYVPKNVTKEAQEIAREHPINYKAIESFQISTKRKIVSKSIKKQLGQKGKLQAKGKDVILLGKTSSIDLSLVEQLVDVSQTRMIANVIKYIALNEQNDLTLSEWLNIIEEKIDSDGLNFNKKHQGDLARPRRFEMAAAINRIRKLQVRQLDGKF